MRRRKVGGVNQRLMDQSSVFSMAAESARSDEESGWTAYFDGFMASQDQKHEHAGVFSCSSAVSGSSSMISDAASRAVALNPLPSASTVVPMEERRDQVRLRRRYKGKWLLDDDDDDSLQDTASSPVNSPKVTEMSCLTMNPDKKDGHRDITAQDGDVGYRKIDEDGGFGLADRSTNVCAGLKNRGLCLVLFPCQ